MVSHEPQFLMLGKRKSGASNDETRKIAYHHTHGTVDGAPTLVWLGGLRSDMTGTKAEALHALAINEGWSFLRFDYTGHGASSAKFEDGTIGQWAEDARDTIDALVQGPVILIGSSMGGWVSLLLARDYLAENQPDRLASMVLIAPAPDFTSKLMWPRFSDAMRNAIEQEGFYAQPSPYEEGPMIITKALIDDGLAQNVMDEPIRTGCSVHIVQGMQDDDVPYTHAQKLLDMLMHENATMTLVKDGDHRLSRPQDIELLERIVIHAVARVMEPT